jgi:hypothetical protein
MEMLMNARAACNAVLFLALVTVTGCTRSLEMTYNPAAYRLAQGDQLRSVAIGIGKFEDRRSWIDRTEPESLAYVMQQGQEVIEDNYRQCLRDRGWQREQKLDPAPIGWYRGIE